MSKEPRVRVPAKAAKGEMIQIRTLFPHEMETGRRKDPKTGAMVPRKIINKFECLYNGQMVFAADLHPAIAANPYLAFSVKAEASGKIEMRWTEDGGAVTEFNQDITVA